jgi:ubiquitin-like domain-containing CTD phosphatase 1
MSEINEILFKWNGKDFKVDNLLPNSTIADLKNELCKMTNVLPERQKLLGLKAKSGRNLSDSNLIEELNYKKGTKIMMMGTVEEKIDDVNKKPENLPEVVNDLDIDPNDEEVTIENREENLAKISRRVKEYKINILNEMRPNKKLLGN